MGWPASRSWRVPNPARVMAQAEWRVRIPRGTPHQLDFDCLCQFKIGDLTHPGCLSGGGPSGRMCRAATAANEVGHFLEASIPGAPAGFDEFPPSKEL
jgi:hypothetical protein